MKLAPPGPGLDTPATEKFTSAASIQTRIVLVRLIDSYLFFMSQGWNINKPAPSPEHTGATPSQCGPGPGLVHLSLDPVITLRENT